MEPTSPKRTGITGHDLLLRMAGRIPDQTLAQARRTLAEGKVAEAIAPVAELLTATPILLTAEEIAAIRDLSGKADALPGAEPADEPLPLEFGFSEFDERGEVNRDEIDEELVAAAETHAENVASIWRVWRYFVQDDQTPDEQAVARATLLPEATEPYSPHRVYIVEVDDPAMVGTVGAGLLSALPDAASAGIEIVARDGDLPPYQDAAFEESRLLWATQMEPEFSIARVFDFARPDTGPGFEPDHLVIDDLARRESLLTYLRNGYPVLMTTSTMEDVVDQTAGSVVPGSFRTDGEWIWTDTVEYYLSHYRLAPDLELTEHIEAQIALGTTVPDTDQETAIRASDFLLYPPPAEARTPVWFPGG